jgi:hypothetical protein
MRPIHTQPEVVDHTHVVAITERDAVAEAVLFAVEVVDEPIIRVCRDAVHCVVRGHGCTCAGCTQGHRT